MTSPRTKKELETLKDWHDRLGGMIDQVGSPDYSLHEMVSGMRRIRDEMIARAVSLKENRRG